MASIFQLRPEAHTMRRLANLSFFLSIILLLTMIASAQLQTRGTWKIDHEGQHEAGKVHLNIYHDNKDHYGHDIAITELKGLDARSLETDGPVSSNWFEKRERFYLKAR